MPQSILAVNRFCQVVFRKACTALRMSRHELIWFICLYPLSGIFRAVILYLPFHHLARYLGHDYANTLLSTVVGQEQLEKARKIGHICRLVARYTPWESKCFVQATMALTLLRFYAIPYVFHFGLARSQENGMNSVANKTELPTNRSVSHNLSAHAWVKVGSKVITGGEGHRSFTVVGIFVGLGNNSPNYRRN